VLPHIVNEMRARRLIKISHPASKQREFGVLEFRQIEREGDFSWNQGFTVCRRGNHIHWRRTGQRRDVQVCNLAKNLIFAGSRSQID